MIVTFRNLVHVDTITEQYVYVLQSDLSRHLPCNEGDTSWL